MECWQAEAPIQPSTQQSNPLTDEHFSKAVIKMHLESTYLCLIRPWVSMEIPFVVIGTSCSAIADHGPRGHGQTAQPWLVTLPSPFHP